MFFFPCTTTKFKSVNKTKKNTSSYLPLSKNKVVVVKGRCLRLGIFPVRIKLEIFTYSHNFFFWKYRVKRKSLVWRTLKCVRGREYSFSIIFEGFFTFMNQRINLRFKNEWRKSWKCNYLWDKEILSKLSPFTDPFLPWNGLIKSTTLHSFIIQKALWLSSKYSAGISCYIVENSSNFKQ